MSPESLGPVESLSSAVLSSWTADPWLLTALGVTSALYVLGWLRLRRRVSGSVGPHQLASFLGGMALLVLAVSSPLDAFGTLSLSVHMTQHLLLMMLVPPLLWMGAPALPLMHGLPRAFVRDGLGPFLAAPSMQRLAGVLGRPLVCWLAFQLSTWIWHVPALYELALRSSFWHGAEHAVFLVTGLMFWWPVVRPWPARRDGSPWILVLYLISADLLNTVFSAIFTFADRVIYPTYAMAPQLGDGTALDDQVRAGVIMWVPGSLIFLAPLATLIVRALDRAGERAREEAVRQRRVAEAEAFALSAGGLAPTPRRGARRVDLLRMPLLSWLGSRRARRVAQGVTLGLAAVVVADGFLGPDLSPLNLAGVLPWTWARGLMVVGLLLFGAAFCWACPFTAPRGLAERLLGGRREWPRALRSKWFVVGLIVLFLFAYEAWALWDRPAWTAALVCAYFVAAFVIDGLFRGAAFCKWVCPLGQFQFACSTVSPVEVAVVDPTTCERCATHDCLRGNEQQPGCALDLFLPEKTSGLDCTACMDCVAACPHDNAGLLLTAPGVTLLEDPPRSSIGRLSRRTDLAVLALVLVWGGLLNAAVMVGPVQGAVIRLVDAWGLGVAPGLAAGLFVLGALVLLLALTVAVTGLVSRAGSLRLAWALLPLGFAMWLAHFAMHLVTGWGAAVPAGLRALGSLGWAPPTASGAATGMAHAMAVPDGLLTLQLLALDLGLLISLYLGWRVAGGQPGDARVGRRLLRVLPYGLLAGALWGMDVWVLLQPMQMRGTMGVG